MVKNPPVSAGDEGLIPGSARSSAGGNSDLTPYSYLEKFHGQRSLAGYSLRGHKAQGMT